MGIAIGVVIIAAVYVGALFKSFYNANFEQKNNEKLR